MNMSNYLKKEVDAGDSKGFSRLNLSSKRSSLRDNNIQQLNTGPTQKKYSFLSKLKFHKKPSKSNKQVSLLLEKKKELFEGMLDKDDKELAVQIMGLIKEFKKERKV